MVDLDISPPQELTVSLWRSLLLNVIDRVAPERLPPLQLTSKPVAVGISAGDLLELPWYRTVFSNLADVISPDTLPPLQLESRPVDVGELLGDALDYGWWYSLLGNIRDRLAPEKLPPLELTSRSYRGVRRQRQPSHPRLVIADQHSEGVLARCAEASVVSNGKHGAVCAADTSCCTGSSRPFGGAVADDA